uniref:protein disulfide-isomerase n=1 Tax=Lygus hesperus TaxID=30085 RepID=A0A0A9Z873_LYGHE
MFYSEQYKEIEPKEPHSVELITRELLQFITSIVHQRNNIPVKPAKEDTPTHTEPANPNAATGANDGTVVEYNSRSFKDIFNTEALVIVSFTAPWCGHCKALKPEYAKAARMLAGNENVILGNVDCTANQQLCGKYDVRGYPTISVFPKGVKTPSTRPSAYPGARTAEAIVSYVKSEIGQDAVAKVPQVTSFMDVVTCAKNSICMVGVLPPMEDSSVKQRTEYLNTMKRAAAAVVDKPISWIWVSGKEQREMEKSFEINGNYPTLIAVATKKKMYSTMIQAFDYDNILTFIDDILRGRVSASPITDLPEISRVEPWSPTPIENKDEL